jgi:rhodanese-related sulfurtransferase
MFWKRSTVIELDPAEVQELLARGDVVLVDVREAREHAAERIAGAVCMPLSRFDPAGLPGEPAKVVFHCLSGQRSATAVRHCERAGIAVSGHMRGGIAAWKAARLPTQR